MRSQALAIGTVTTDTVGRRGLAVIPTSLWEIRWREGGRRRSRRRRGVGVSQYMAFCMHRLAIAGVEKGWVREPFFFYHYFLDNLLYRPHGLAFIPSKSS